MTLRMKRISVLAISLTTLWGGLMVKPPSVMALDLDASEIRGKAKQNPVAVLQNRYFLKSFRPEVGIAFGSFLNEAYTDTTVSGVRASMFMNEWIGFEFQNLSTTVEDSDDRKALNTLKYEKIGTEGEIVSPDPEVNPIYGVQDYSLIVAPFYGKLNLMNQMILYSDLYFTAGMARVDTEQGMKSSATFGVGQRFYFLKSLSVRVDFKDRIFKEQRAGEETTKHAYSVDFGASYFFL